MTTMFEDLVIGLDEVDAFLAGENAGYKVSVEFHSRRSLAKPKGETAGPSARLRFGSDDKG